MTNEQRAQETQAEVDLGIIPNSTTAFGEKRGEKFDALVSEFEGISEAIKQLETEKKALQSRLQQYFADSDIKTVLVGQTKVTLVVNQGRSTIDKVKLIEHGVPAQTIVECTVQGEPFSFVKVTPPRSR